MKVTYIGPHSGGVDLAMPDGGWVTVPQGGEVEVDESHGKSLLDQKDNWARAKAADKPIPARPAKDGE